MHFKSFRDFWPYYLREHSVALNRTLHFIGTGGAIVLALIAALSRKPWLWALVPVFGYGFAWFGHFVIEKNKPATFQHPFYSLIGDFKMLFCIVTGRIDRELTKATGQAR